MSTGKRFWESRDGCLKISVQKGKISILIQVHVYIVVALYVERHHHIAPPFLSTGRDATQVSASSFPLYILLLPPWILRVKISEPLESGPVSPLEENKAATAKFIKTWAQNLHSFSSSSFHSPKTSQNVEHFRRHSFWIGSIFYAFFRFYYKI